MEKICGGVEQVLYLNCGGYLKTVNEICGNHEDSVDFVVSRGEFEELIALGVIDDDLIEEYENNSDIVEIVAQF